MTAIRSVCVFCGSSEGSRPAYASAARALGEWLATRDITLVYGAGSIGLMGKIAEAVLERGGKVVGVIPKKLAKAEVMHQGLSELHVVESMHERKALMSQLSDALISLPGGFGTFEETLEVITWAQLGIQRKPIGLWNVEGYWDGLLSLVDHGIAEGFIRPQYRDLFVVDATLGGLLSRIEAYAAPPSILVDMGLEET